jgi:nucleotide-binding universal stress UspA family protein
MRKIIITTDFSDNAFNALKYACQLFKHEQCEFFIVHAYADEVYQRSREVKRSVFEELKEVTHVESDSGLSQTKKAVIETSKNPKHNFKTVSRFDTLTDALNDLVNEEDIDMVVMGTRGRSETQHYKFGSNTLHVMKYVQCPVMAIPIDYSFQVPKNILFPTNYLIPYKRRELQLLCDLADSYRSKITMLYIDPVEHLSLRQEDNMKFLKECLYKPKLIFETGPQDDKSSVILNHVRNHGTHLLAMVNSRHTLAEDLLYTSTIDKLGIELKIPYLVLQNLSR